MFLECLTHHERPETHADPVKWDIFDFAIELDNLGLFDPYSSMRMPIAVEKLFTLLC